MRVLLAETDRAARSALEVVLAQRGHEVTVCQDFESSLNELAGGGYAFIVAGIANGNASGTGNQLADLQRILDQTAECQIQTVLLISPGDPPSPELQLPAELVVQIDKPINISMLRDRLAEVEASVASRKEPEPELAQGAESPAGLLPAIRHLADLVMILDEELVIDSISASGGLWPDAFAAELAGQPVSRLVHEVDEPVFLAALEQVTRPGQTATLVLQVRRPGDRWIDAECRIVSLADGQQGQGLLVAVRDVSRQQQLEAKLRAARSRLAEVERNTLAQPAEDRLQQSESLIAHLVQNATEMLAVLDPEGCLIYQSPAVERGLGYPEQRLQSFAMLELVHPDDAEQAARQFEQSLANPGEDVDVEMRIQHADGSWRYIEATFTNHLEDDALSGIVVNAQDITERKVLEQRLTRQAFYDSLTRLPNRALFMHRLDQALSHERATGHPVTMLFLDLDRFKVVNDSLGHEIGDRLLVAIAHRLRETVRPGDTVARLGGDEFIILLRGITNPDEVAHIARRVIRDVDEPVQLNGYEVTVSTSIGVASGNPGQTTAQDLLRNADIALYRAKDAGGDNYVVFDASMARQAVDRLELENDLRQAVSRHEFRLQYLPEIDLESGELVSLEALIRWRHPERGYVLPDEFMSVAEETGLIVPIGRWAINHACEQMQRWLETRTEASDLVISINLTAREFQQPDLVPFIISTLDRYGLSPNRLRLEIAETVMIADPGVALEKLRKLREHNIGLAIDNFGSGYSSLAYLTQVSFSTLKIDRQFVSGPGGITSNLSIVRAITSLAHALRMSVTAEGIENRDHLTRVRAAGCDSGQGFLFSEALAGHAVESLLFNQLSE